jgi:hypothetical protein
MRRARSRAAADRSNASRNAASGIPARALTSPALDLRTACASAGTISNASPTMP